MYKNKPWTNQLADIFKFYETECEGGRAQGMPAKGALKTIQRLFKENGYEFCAHNAAILGSKRYAKDKIEGIDKMLTTIEYNKIMKEKIND